MLVINKDTPPHHNLVAKYADHSIISIMCKYLYNIIMYVYTEKSVWWTNRVISIQAHVSRETSQWKRWRLLLLLLSLVLKNIGVHIHNKCMYRRCIEVTTLSILFIFSVHILFIFFSYCRTNNLLRDWFL